MKLLKKIIAFLCISIFTLALSLLLIAELAENTVTRLALNKLNDGVDAKISVQDVDFSLIKNFPSSMVELQNVTISTADDTLAHVNRIYISIETRPLLKSQFNIKEITVEGGLTNYRIYKNGSTNFDVFLAVPEEQENDTTSESIYLLLEELKLNNLFCSFKDEANDIEACLYIDEANANVQINDLNKIAGFNGTLRANNCHYPDSKLKLMEETKLSLDINYKNDQIDIKNILIETDGAMLQANGSIKQGHSIETNLHISSSLFDFNILKKYIPDSLLTAYDINHIAGLASIRADIEGLYNDSTMPLISATIKVQKGNIAMADYPALNNLQLNVNYTNGELRNNQTTQITIDTLLFTSGQSRGLLSCSVANLDAIKYSINSDLSLNLKELLQHMPDSIIEDLNGRLNLQFSTRGELPNNLDEKFADYLLAKSKASIELNNVDAKLDSTLNLVNFNGLLSYQNKSFTIEELNGQLPTYPLNIIDGSLSGQYKGSIVDLNTLELQLSEFDISTDDSRIYGTTNISNIEHPTYSIDANADVNLAEFKPFAPDSLVKDMSGTIKAYVSSKGTINLDSIVDQSMAILFNQSIINTSFEDVQIAMQDSLLHVNKLNGELALKSDSLSIKKLSGEFSNIAFGTDSASIINIYNAYWLNQTDTIKVDGNFNLGDIDYTLVEAFMAEDSTQTQPATDNTIIAEPSRYSYQAKGKITAKSFKYNKALFENLSALYNVSDTLYLVDQFKFDAFKGSINSSIRYQAYREDEQRLFFKNKTDKIDINQLLSDFDDFKEYDNEYISREQLTGLLSTDLLGEVVIRDSVITEEIRMQGGFLLEDGRLQNYDIAVEMGKDYDIPGMEDIIFKTIDTKLFVFDNSIYAPQTDIKTNKFNVTLFGMQNFNLDCQYHLRFYLKEILRKGQTDRLEKRQSNEKKVKDDGGTKGLMSLFAIYKVKDGKTVKSDIEGEKSDERGDMKRKLRVKKKQIELIFDPDLVKYNTGIDEEKAL